MTSSPHPLSLLEAAASLAGDAAGGRLVLRVADRTRRVDVDPAAAEEAAGHAQLARPAALTDREEDLLHRVLVEADLAAHRADVSEQTAPIDARPRVLDEHRAPVRLAGARAERAEQVANERLLHLLPLRAEERLPLRLLELRPVNALPPAAAPFPQRGRLLFREELARAQLHLAAHHAADVGADGVDRGGVGGEGREVE
eukprot:CAMPEP_0113263378 /NCGR_PEP_ID=MMETSP0008_2-20120614/18420_1 /TAXON_ID=97485 /ORGANISM="Prymnesium parvum" /LENGTH=199 /DNA_ID=CAMNT_0000112093 /DNA_START=274 /DNA_END=874 /DNA_ORIENTATION=+ /assembly_acc=CAM_ASM_000153